MQKINIQDVNSGFIRTRDNTDWRVLFDHVDQANLGCIMLKPGAAQIPHYHKEGADIFIISEGRGKLHYGDVDQSNEQLSNKTTIAVEKGDIYFVEPYQMHALENTGDEQLIWINIAPGTHSTTDTFNLE